jgi:steroid delta-isomerase-like uncharacterized protein
MSAANKAISKRLFTEGMNEGKLEVIDELVAPNWVDHDPSNPPDLPPGAQGLKQLMSMYRAAFPDMVMTIEEQIAEGDKVVSRWVAKGTHNGDLAGIPPTGKQVTVTGIFIDRISGGQIQESWANWDALGMLQQVGAVPTPEAAKSR